MPRNKTWKPSEDDFDTCVDVLNWMITWYMKNDPDAIELKTLQDAELEIPESVEEFLSRDDE